MFTIVLLAALAAPAGAESDPADLVSKLGASRFAEREAASEAIERRGRDALPALRAAREAKDPEVRTRAAALLEKIESSLMIRPTLVRLDFRDRPLPEVVKAVAERSAIPLALVPENNAVWQSRRVTLEAPEPVPFWTALERLCREGKLQHNVGAQGPPFGPQGIGVQLFAGTGGGMPFASDRGPFRASVLGIHHHRDTVFPQGGPMNGLIVGLGPVPNRPVGRINAMPAPPSNAASSDNFYLDLQLMVEPRMMLNQRAPMKLVEAVDDKGQSLLPPAAGVGAAAARHPGFSGYPTGSIALQYRVDLRYPAEPGKAVKRLKGTVPVWVAARKDDPLVAPLADAKGKTFRDAGTSLTVRDVRPELEQRRTLIEISVRQDSAPQDGSPMGVRFGPEMMDFPVPALMNNQVEVLGAQGRPLRHLITGAPRVNNEEAQVTLMVLTDEAVGPPVELRYYDMLRTQTEAAFEFSDIPMP